MNRISFLYSKNCYFSHKIFLLSRMIPLLGTFQIVNLIFRKNFLKSTKPFTNIYKINISEKVVINMPTLFVSVQLQRRPRC